MSALVRKCVRCGWPFSSALGEGLSFRPWIVADVVLGGTFVCVPLIQIPIRTGWTPRGPEGPALGVSGACNRFTKGSYEYLRSDKTSPMYPDGCRLTGVCRPPGAGVIQPTHSGQ